MLRRNKKLIIITIINKLTKRIFLYVVKFLSFFFSLQCICIYISWIFFLKIFFYFKSFCCYVTLLCSREKTFFLFNSAKKILLKNKSFVKESWKLKFMYFFSLETFDEKQSTLVQCTKTTLSRLITRKCKMFGVSNEIYNH